MTSTSAFLSHVEASQFWVTAERRAMAGTSHPQLVHCPEQVFLGFLQKANDLAVQSIIGERVHQILRRRRTVQKSSFHRGVSKSLLGQVCLLRIPIAMTYNVSCSGPLFRDQFKTGAEEVRLICQLFIGRPATGCYTTSVLLGMVEHQMARCALSIYVRTGFDAHDRDDPTLSLRSDLRCA